MNLKQNNFKVAIYIGIIFFIVLEIFSLIYVDYLKTKEVQFLNKLNACNFEEDIHFTQNFLSDFSQLLYDRVLNKPKMNAIMAEASKTKDKEKLSELRDELYNYFLKDYDYMKSKFVRQVHFHLPGTVSFLRFHRPKKYGDSLKNIRLSIEYVNREKKPISVFEEGRIFNGFRNVYPIFKDKEFVGTVEVSYSFKAIQEELKSAKKMTILFLLNNDLVSKKLFSSESSNYVKSEFESFAYDKAILKSQKFFSLKELHTLNLKIKNDVSKKIQTKEKFTLNFQDDNLFSGNYIDIEFLPVKNIKNKQVAYIVHYKIDERMNLLIHKYKMLLLSLTFLSLLIAFVVGMLLKKAKVREENAKNIAMYDRLTHIYNRHGLDELMRLKIADFNRHKRDLSIIFFDIDHFKHVNDQYGHAVGDDVLMKLAALVESNIRESDIFARWGGEEFVIVLSETALHDARILAEKIRMRIELYNFEKPSKLTCSFGVTEMYQNESEQEMMKRADEYLYRAKELGRNRVVYDVES